MDMEVDEPGADPGPGRIDRFSGVESSTYSLDSVIGEMSRSVSIRPSVVRTRPLRIAIIAALPHRLAESNRNRTAILVATPLVT